MLDFLMALIVLIAAIFGVAGVIYLLAQALRFGRRRRRRSSRDDTPPPDDWTDRA